MSLQDDVRAALKPLIDEGAIVAIETNLATASYEGGLRLESFVAIIPAATRDSYRARINELLYRAGLLDKVSVHIRGRSTLRS